MIYLSCVIFTGWVQKRLMKLYIDSCKELSEAPNMKLLKKLYVSEVRMNFVGDAIVDLVMHSPNCCRMAYYITLGSQMVLVDFLFTLCLPG